MFFLRFWKLFIVARTRQMSRLSCLNSLYALYIEEVLYYLSTVGNYRNLQQCAASKSFEAATGAHQRFKIYQLYMSVNRCCIAYQVIYPLFFYPGFLTRPILFIFCPRSSPLSLSTSRPQHHRLLHQHGCAGNQSLQQLNSHWPRWSHDASH